MPKIAKKPTLKILAPVLLTLGLVFGLGNLILNIPEYIESVNLKLSYPESYEFKIYDRVLKKHVSYGLVDYASAKKDPELLAAYEELKKTSPDKLKGKLEQLSFWINTYNLLTIKCICDLYPLKQLRQEAATKRFLVGGKIYTLDEIKDEVLPPLIRGSDWRAIFLLCGGAVSSPYIADHAYTPSILSDEFESATKRFVLSKVNYRIDEKERTLSISPYYRWNLEYIDEVFPSPFDMVVSFLPPAKKVDLDQAFRNYAMPFDWRINDTALLKGLKLNQSNSLEIQKESEK